MLASWIPHRTSKRRLKHGRTLHLRGGSLPAHQSAAIHPLLSLPLVPTPNRLRLRGCRSGCRFDRVPIVSLEAPAEERSSDLVRHVLKPRGAPWFVFGQDNTIPGDGRIDDEGRGDNVDGVVNRLD